MFTTNAKILFENAMANTKLPVRERIAVGVQFGFKEGGFDPINQHQIKNIISRAVMIK